eukprot:3152304-Amphidinium_carterae.1
MELESALQPHMEGWRWCEALRVAHELHLGSWSPRQVLFADVVAQADASRPAAPASTKHLCCVQF